MANSSKKAIITALGANLAIAAAKAVGGLKTGSGTLIAEAMHSAADCVNQLMLLIGLKQAEKKPDSKHPFGYERAAYFYSMAVAFMLFFVAGVASVLHGIEALNHLKPVTNVEWSIGILLFGVLVEGYALYSAIKVAREEFKGKSINFWFKETKDSNLLIVVAEDAGALIGLFVALMALSLTYITKNPIFDAIGAITVGSLLVAVSIKVMIEVKALIIGEAISDRYQNLIRSYVEADSSVLKLNNMLTQQIGRKKMVCLKIRFKELGSSQRLAEAIEELEEKIQKDLGIDWIMTEPDYK